MFDIGLLELFLIAVVSILVLGPEKLPIAIRSIAKTFYWFKRQTSDAKEEMNKAFDLNEVYQDSRNEEILDGIKEQKD
tara:strand:- start:255 stop:488 length:234 start_codon:yes stop_codon:yes gene_type:complete